VGLNSTELDEALEQQRCVQSQYSYLIQRQKTTLPLGAATRIYTRRFDSFINDALRIDPSHTPVHPMRSSSN